MSNYLPSLPLPVLFESRKTLLDFHQILHSWTKKNLPKLNLAIEEGRVNPFHLVMAFEPFVLIFKKRFGAFIEKMTKDEALKSLQLLGFGISSVERHFQASGFASGVGLGNLRGAEELLMKLGNAAKHPPRDSHYTYWLMNNNEQDVLTFTGSKQEAYFNKAVNLTNDLHNASCDILRPFLLGEKDFLSEEAFQAILAVKDNFLIIWDAYRGYMTNDPETGERNMEPAFFMKRMRTYLPTYPIGGKSWPGVNAANVAAQARIDFLIGTVNSEYEAMVKTRMWLMPEDEQALLTNDMQVKSLTQKMCEVLELSPASLVEIDEVALEGLAKGLSGEQKSVLSAYGRLIRAASRLTSAHWGLIQTYLVKPSQSLSESEMAALPVKPTHGTGGRSHEETEKIMTMRTKHPIAEQLLKLASFFQTEALAS